jgi:hypothetical protein
MGEAPNRSLQRTAARGCSPQPLSSSISQSMTTEGKLNNRKEGKL